MFPANNQIESIPTEIGGLTLLQELALRKCIACLFSMIPVIHSEL
jgi:hypothetical protein